MKAPHLTSDSSLFPSKSSIEQSLGVFGSPLNASLAAGHQVTAKNWETDFRREVLDRKLTVRRSLLADVLFYVGMTLLLCLLLFVFSMAFPELHKSPWF